MVLEQNKKALITGACGFIGGHVSECLLREGWQVKGVDCMTDYYDVRIKKETLSILSRYSGFQFVQVDISDRVAMDRAFDIHGPFDVVIHLAAQPGVRVSCEKPAEVIKVNIEGTQVIFDNVKKYDVPYCVAASSSSVYGKDSVAPYSEDQVCAEPISPYAASKRANELFAHAYYHLYGIPVTMLRFFTVYGPRGRPDMAAYKFIERIEKGDSIEKYGDGSAVREFTYIDDIVNGVMCAVKNPNGFQIVNLGGGSTHTVNEFIKTIEEVCGKEAIVIEKPEMPGDVKLTSACQKRAKELLGFEPKTSLREGIEKTVAWYRVFQERLLTRLPSPQGRQSK